MGAPFIVDAMADSETAADILNRKFPGLLPDAPSNGNAIPLLNAVAPRPTLGANTPDAPRPSPTGASHDPYTPQDLIPRQGAAPTPPPRSPNSYLPWTQEFRDYQQTQSKAQKLGTILKSGIMGAIAGQAASEQAVIQSGGRRSAGFGTGAMAAIEQPIQQAAQQQAVQRGGLENQILGAQAQYAPQIQALNFSKTMADIEKNLADAKKMTAEAGAVPAKSALENAQALAARYKEDPGSGQLVDLQTGQPYGNSTGIAPLTAEEATVLGKQPGERVPVKLKNIASEIAARGLTTVNTEEGVFERNRITGTNTRLGNNPREISLDTPVGALDNTTGKQVMVTRKDIIANPGRFAPVSADVSTPVIKQTLKEYASTKPNTAGGNIIAFNTAMAHLGLLNDAIDALGNGNMKIFNSIGQKYKEQTGSTVGGTFDTVKQAVSGELAKVTGSLSQGEQEAIKGPLDKSNY